MFFYFPASDVTNTPAASSYFKSRRQLRQLSLKREKITVRHSGGASHRTVLQWIEQVLSVYGNGRDYVFHDVS